MSERKKRDDAIKRAKENPENNYEEIAEIARRLVLKLPPGALVVSGQIFKAAMEKNPDLEPRERRVMGPIMRLLEKEYLVVKAGISTRERAHKGLTREWKRTKG